MSTTIKAARKNGTKPDTRSKAAAPGADADDATLGVLAIDDDPAFLFLLRRRLEEARSERFNVRQAGDAHEALTLLQRDTGIGLVLLDHRLDGAMTGMDLLKQLRGTGDHRPVIMMTAYGNEYLAADLARCGANDYLVKNDIDAERLRRTVDRVLDHWREGQAVRRQRSEIMNRLARLTPREREVVDLVVAGLKNQQIAARLYRSEKTVKIHRANAMAKMRAATPAELTRLVLTAEPIAPLGPRAAVRATPAHSP